MNLSEDDKKELKALAKDTIEAALFSRKDASVDVSEVLKEKRGAFVTLKKKGELRGCIGYIRGVSPLHKTVRDMALQAAFHDPRFNALEKNEWKDVEIEISVLTPLKKINSIDEIEVGVHGLYIEKGYCAGLLLPQVATENNFDKTAFLECTCLKAGLPKDAYESKDANIYIFSADVF
jgi:AmmeMemoRadiSam system protein A